MNINKNKLYSEALFSLLFILSGCTDYLEQKPDERSQLDTLEKTAQALVYAYSKASYAFTERMTDNVTYLPNKDELNWVREIYEWKEKISFTEQDTPTYYWNHSYLAIAQANVALDKINNLKGGDPDYKNAIRGEALLCRAYAHFMLVNLFAKPYDKNTAKNDLGIPYVKKVEKQLLVPYQRKTVKEVYDLVEEDLLEGLKLVSARYYKNSGKFHFNKNSALAFASRFYLWKGDYKKTEEYSNRLLNEGESQFVRNFKEDVLTPRDYIEIENHFSSPSLFSNSLLAKCFIITVGRRFYFKNGGYGYSRENWQDIFLFNNDKRFTIFASGPYLIPRYRYNFKYTDVAQTYGYAISTEVWFMGEEVVYNRAEARLLKENPDIDGAEADLNYILNDRYWHSPTVEVLSTFKKMYTDLGLSQKEALLKLIIDQRRIEFVTQGMRWFDIRRFHLPVTHKLRDGTEDTLTEDDPRKVLQIPSTAIQFGITPNLREVKKVSSKRIESTIKLDRTKLKNIHP